MKFNHAARFERYVEVARALGEAVDQLPAREAAARSFAAVANLGRDIGIPERLGEVHRRHA